MTKLIVDSQGKIWGKVEGDNVTLGDEETDKIINEKPRRLISETTEDGMNSDMPEVVHNPTLQDKLTYVRLIGLFVKDDEEPVANEFEEMVEEEEPEAFDVVELDEDLGSFNLPIEMSYWNRVDPAGLHKNEKERELTERGLNIHEGDAGIVNQ